MFKKIIPIILVSTIIITTSISSEIITYASCTSQNKSQLEDEIKLVDQMLELKTPEEIREKNIQDLQKIKKNDKNSEITKNLIAKIKSANKNNFENTNTAIEYLKFENLGNKVEGTFDFHTLFLYSDNTSGRSVDKYNFTFYKNNQEINVTLIPDIFRENNSPITALQITEKEKKDIEIKKSKLPKQNTKTIESVQNEAKISSKEHFSKIKQYLENQYKCFGLQAKAASGGNYNGYAARNYALQYAVNYNSNYFNYHSSGGDCTNFTSQALFAGGISKDYGNNNSNDMDWYFHWNYPWYGGQNPVASTTWIRVIDQMTHMYYRENTGYWLEFDNSGYSIFDPLQTGDLLYADWTRDGTWDHSMIITGWDWIGGHWEPRLTYHSNNQENIAFSQIRDGNPKFKGLQFFSPVT